MGRSILVVDDDKLMRSFISLVLTEDGHQVQEAAGAGEGLAHLKHRDFDLVITDLKMPDMSGLDLMREGRTVRPETRWIIITAYGSIGSAVQAMKAGAVDYLTKPLGSPDELRLVLARVWREIDDKRSIQLMSEELGRQFPPSEMIFAGARMNEIRAMVEQVAATGATVLVTGPSGTGKELVARTIHQMSPRRGKPFVAVHCAALAENLLESELFGHEKGAFTGALAQRKGRFELSDGGTLFLDEIGEISPAIQVKLLRVIQEREFERVGGNRAIAVDVRLVASTNRDLKAEVAAGRFREDLFYRLNVFPLVLPSLSERREAILSLAEYFAGRSAAAFGKKTAGFTPAAKSALEAYAWPGNIRELQNVIERAVILSPGAIDVSHLNLEGTDEAAPYEEGMLKSLEMETIRKVLGETGGNRTKAAKLLGISLRTLQYRIKAYGL